MKEFPLFVFPFANPSSSIKSQIMDASSNTNNRDAPLSRKSGGGETVSDSSKPVVKHEEPSPPVLASSSSASASSSTTTSATTLNINRPEPGASKKKPPAAIMVKKPSIPVGIRNRRTAAGTAATRTNAAKSPPPLVPVQGGQYWTLAKGKHQAFVQAIVKGKSKARWNGQIFDLWNWTVVRNADGNLPQDADGNTVLLYRSRDKVEDQNLKDTIISTFIFAVVDRKYLRYRGRGGVDRKKNFQAELSATSHLAARPFLNGTNYWESGHRLALKPLGDLLEEYGGKFVALGLPKEYLDRFSATVARQRRHEGLVHRVEKRLKKNFKSMVSALSKRRAAAVPSRASPIAGKRESAARAVKKGKSNSYRAKQESDDDDDDDDDEDEDELDDDEIPPRAFNIQPRSSKPKPPVQESSDDDGFGTRKPPAAGRRSKSFLDDSHESDDEERKPAATARPRGRQEAPASDKADRKRSAGTLAAKKEPSGGGGGGNLAARAHKQARTATQSGPTNWKKTVKSEFEAFSQKVYAALQQDDAAVQVWASVTNATNRDIDSATESMSLSDVLATYEKKMLSALNKKKNTDGLLAVAGVYYEYKSETTEDRNAAASNSGEGTGDAAPGESAASAIALDQD